VYNCIVYNKKRGKTYTENFWKYCYYGHVFHCTSLRFYIHGSWNYRQLQNSTSKQFAPLLYSCFAFLFIKTEKFNILKILGALVGFAGIVAINLGTDVRGLSFGDVLILSASVCSVISMVMSWHIVKKTNPFWITAISQTVGGIILLCAALVLGAQFPVFTLESTLVFTYICIASIVGYVLFGFAQKYSDMTKLFIIKFTEPLIACVFGAVLLGEDILKIQYLVAFVLITAGILLGNRETNNESKDSRN